MKPSLKSLLTATALATAIGALPMTPAIAGDGASNIEKGKKLAFNKKKGNCLACHQIAGGTLAGNIAPPLIAMKARYPDRAKLREQIWDATKRNPHTAMPPFGKHHIVSEKEIDLITDFIHTL